MALTADVVVIGGGLAGSCAALEAREQGAEVLLVARAPGASAVSSGAIDFAADEEDASIGEAARKLARVPGHPYGLLGDGLVPALDDAIELLRRHLAPLGVSGARMAADRNLWLLSPLGFAKPAALAQSAIAAGDLRNLAPREARAGIVAFAGTQAVEARLVASGLTRLLGSGSEAVVVAPDLFHTRGDALRTLPEIARDLDQPGRRAALADSLGRAAAQASVTHLFVPTLGIEDPAAMRAELERIVQKPVFELLGAPPSVPGLRLQTALERALTKAGVRTIRGIAERGAGDEVQIVRGVECERVQAGAVVLASGRFLGGGLRCEPDGRLRETVFDLPAIAAGRTALTALPNEHLFAERAAGPHPGLTAGVAADGELRAGRVFACGAVLAGFDPARGQGGLGVCAVTGLVAGRRAARSAGRTAASAPGAAVLR
ncbi:MAG TPA: FAD-dependent oxidoreductase [Myxococcales bacterium]|nr:FAD-dependent oxidoreductase [Myxococcales bacterium]